MRQQRDYPRHARIQRIDRNDAGHRKGRRQTYERGPALPAKRAVFHNRAGDGFISYQPTSIAKLSGQGDNPLCIGGREYPILGNKNQRNAGKELL